MNIYVLIGFNFSNNLILKESDKLLYKKIYIVGNEGQSDNEDVVVIGDKNILEFYEEFKLETLEDNIVFIDCRNNAGDTYLDVMYTLNTAIFDNRAYYIHKGKTLTLSDYPLKKHFCPWEGEQLPSELSVNEKKAIKSMFNNLVKVTRSYLKAGFYYPPNTNKPKILNVPDGWMMNIYTPEIEHLIRYYGLIPEVKDVNRALEFIHNAQYRRIVTETMVKVVANYLVRNNIVNTMDIDDWYNYKNWDIQKLILN
jgi:hypothetical protein